MQPPAPLQMPSLSLDFSQQGFESQLRPPSGFSVLDSPLNIKGRKMLEQPSLASPAPNMNMSGDSISRIDAASPPPVPALPSNLKAHTEVPVPAEAVRIAQVRRSPGQGLDQRPPNLQASADAAPLPRKGSAKPRSLDAEAVQPLPLAARAAPAQAADIAQVLAEQDRCCRRVEEVGLTLGRSLAAHQEQQELQTKELKDIVGELRASSDYLKAEQYRQASAVAETQALQRAVHEMTERLEREVRSLLQACRSDLSQVAAQSSEILQTTKDGRGILAASSRNLQDSERTLNPDQVLALTQTSQLQAQIADMAATLRAEITSLSAVVGSNVQGLASIVEADGKERSLELSRQHAELEQVAVYVREATAQREELSKVAQSIHSAAQQRDAELVKVTQSIKDMHQGMSHSAMLEGAWEPLSGQSRLDASSSSPPCKYPPGDVLPGRGIGPRAAVFDARPGVLLLMYRAEASCRHKLSFLASCFHSWRCETTLLRAGESMKKDFERHQASWKALLDQSEQKVQAQRQQWRENAALNVLRWSELAGTNLLSHAFGSWKNWRHKNRKETSVRRRVYLSFAQSLKEADRAIRHLCFSAWENCAHRKASEELWDQRTAADDAAWRQRLEEVELGWQRRLESEQQAWQQRLEVEQGAVSNRFEAERGTWKQRLDEEASSWRQRLEQECSRSESQLQVAVDAVEQAQVRAQHDVLMLLMRWEAGSDMELAVVALRAWRRLASASQVRLQASRGVADRLAEASAVRSAGACLRRWHMSCVRHRKALAMYFQAWKMCFALRVQANVHTGMVSAAIAKFNMRDCGAALERSFWHWKAMAATARLTRVLDAELQSRVDAWETLSAEERRKHRDAVAEHKARVERASNQVEAVASFVMAGLEVSCMADTMTKVLHAWATNASEASRSRASRLRQYSAFAFMCEATERSSLSTSLLRWKAAVTELRMERMTASAQEARRQGQRETHVLTRQVAEVLLQKWQSSGRRAMLRATFRGWCSHHETLLQGRWRQAAVGNTTVRCLAACAASALRLCFMSWVCGCEVSRICQSATEEIQVQLKQREAETEALAADSEEKAASAAEAQERLQQTMLERDKAQRELSVVMQEQHRRQESQLQRGLRMQAATLELLACKDWGIAVLELFLAWRDAWQRSVEEHRYTTATENCMHLMQRHRARFQQSEILASCLRRWHAEVSGGSLSVRQTEALKEAAAGKSAQREKEMQQLVEQEQQEKAALQVQLTDACQQVEQLTASLRTQSQLRQELEDEIQQADERRGGGQHFSRGSSPAAASAGMAWPGRPVYSASGGGGGRLQSFGRSERSAASPAASSSSGILVREVVREPAHGLESSPASLQRRAGRVERAGFSVRAPSERNAQDATDEVRSDTGPLSSRSRLLQMRQDSTGSLADRVGSLQRSRSAAAMERVPPQDAAGSSTGGVASRSHSIGAVSSVAASSRRSDFAGWRSPSFPAFPDSPGRDRCSWDAAVDAMQDEGILRHRN